MKKPTEKCVLDSGEFIKYRKRGKVVNWVEVERSNHVS